MKIKKYPDGSSYAIMDEFKPQFITKRINTYEDLWHLGQMLEVANYNGAEPIVTIPNLIDAQADRRFVHHQTFGLKMVTDFLNSFKVTKYKVFHPHNPAVLEALLNKVQIIDNFGFIAQVLSEYFNNGTGIYGDYVNNIILMSADAGGFKPLIDLTNKLNWNGEVYSATKSRKFIENKTKLTQIVDRDDFGGKDIIIIDDISVYGGTFKGLAEILKSKNIGKLYLAVSHMTVQNLGEDPVTNYFDKVFTTNSKFNHYYYEENAYMTYDEEGNKYMYKRNVTPENLKIIKLF